VFNETKQYKEDNNFKCQATKRNYRTFTALIFGCVAAKTHRVTETKLGKNVLREKQQAERSISSV
jgi:hypothetical protein